MEEFVMNLIQGASTDKVVLFALIMIVADLLTGFIKAFYLQEFKSSVARKGILGKCEWLIVLIVSYITIKLFNTGAFASAIACACIITEFSSILENLYACGIDCNLMNYLSIKEKDK